MFLALSYAYLKSCKFPTLVNTLASVSAGGALKPTDIDTLWVHVTCAWFQPEVAFYDEERMEPAMGILRIASNSFVKVFFLLLPLSVKMIHYHCCQEALFFFEQVSRACFDFNPDRTQSR